MKVHNIYCVLLDTVGKHPGLMAYGRVRQGGGLRGLAVAAEPLRGPPYPPVEVLCRPEVRVPANILCYSDRVLSGSV